MMYQIILPNKPSQEYLIRFVQAQYQIWKEEKEAREPQWQPENVRFVHDPEWRSRFWSIQAAHDCDDWRWKFVRVVYVAAAAAPYLIRLL